MQPGSHLLKTLASDVFPKNSSPRIEIYPFILHHYANGSSYDIL